MNPRPAEPIVVLGRLRAVPLRLVITCLLVAAVGGLASGGPPAAAAAVDGPVPAEQYRFCMVVTPGALPGPADLTRLFDHEPAGVVGADYPRATALPDGRVLWTFQDAAVRTSGGAIVTVHNIAVLQNGACFSVLYRGTRADPRPYLFAERTTPFHRWFWPLDAAIGSDGRVYVYTAEMVERSEETPHAYLRHTEPVATHVAVFDPVTSSIVDTVTPPNSSPSLYGWSVTADDDWTYLYAHCYRQFGYDVYALAPAFDQACAGRVTVARVPRGELWAAHQYWDGARWQHDPARAAALGGLAAQRVNASQFRAAGNRFWVVNKEGDWWGNTVYVYVSERPTGPFRQIAAVPEPRKCDECNTFFADWVPPQAVDAGAGQLVYSLSHNRWDGTPSAHYRPTFHTVRAPAYPLRAGDTVRVRVPPAEPGSAPPVAAALNVTAVAPRAAGHLTVHACDEPLPLASNLNYPAGAGAVANLVLTRVDDHGDVCIRSHSAADLVVDLAGTFAEAVHESHAAFVPEAAPVRLVDTRDGTGGSPRLEAERSVAVPVGPGAVVALNLTAVAPDAPGYLTASSCDGPRPLTSNVNYTVGQTVAVLAVVRAGDDGNVCVFSKAATDVVVDLAGRFPTAGTGSIGDPADVGLLDPLPAPTRLADTRAGGGGAPVPGGTAAGVTIPGARPGGTAVLSVAAVDPHGPGFLTVYACERGLPTASNVNYLAGQNAANLVLAAVDATGSVCVYSKADADVIVDLAATLPGSPGGYRPTPNPVRLIDTRISGLDR